MSCQLQAAAEQPCCCVSLGSSWCTGLARQCCQAVQLAAARALAQETKVVLQHSPPVVTGSSRSSSSGGYFTDGVLPGSDIWAWCVPQPCACRRVLRTVMHNAACTLHALWPIALNVRLKGG
jgi:hypothetical protein